MGTQKRFIIVNQNNFTAGCRYYNLPAVTIYNGIISTLYHAKDAVAEISILENGFQVEKILSAYEYNDLLLQEYKKKTDKGLILTGSLALHVYRPLNRYINNINTLCDYNVYGQIANKIVPRDYYCLQNDDPRSWGVIMDSNIEVLVKNQIAYKFIDDVKIALLEDIIASKIYLGIHRNFKYLMDIEHYLPLCPTLNFTSI